MGGGGRLSTGRQIPSRVRRGAGGRRGGDFHSPGADRNWPTSTLSALEEGNAARASPLTGRLGVPERSSSGATRRRECVWAKDVPLFRRGVARRLSRIPWLIFPRLRTRRLRGPLWGRRFACRVGSGEDRGARGRPHGLRSAWHTHPGHPACEASARRGATGGVTGCGYQGAPSCQDVSRRPAWCAGHDATGAPSCRARRAERNGAPAAMGSRRAVHPAPLRRSRRLSPGQAGGNLARTYQVPRRALGGAGAVRRGERGVWAVGEGSEVKTAGGQGLS